ncbi:hypothetical protein BGX34_010425, partial [Mortierella sp. NVP85]
EEDERFWVTDGRSFTVYSTEGGWSVLYRLDMQSQPDSLAARTAMMSIHGRYFAWAGIRGMISIWDFQTGQLFSHVFTGAQDNTVFPVLSPDGSMIAVTHNNTIQIHDTRTGIKLGVFKKGLRSSMYFEVIFGKDHFMAYNPEAATVSKPMKHNMRSLVRLRDMAVVKTIPVHEDYRFNHPQTTSDPVFTFCHGPNLNILKMGSILSPVEKNQCGAHGMNRICETEPLNHFIISSTCRQTLESKGGERFILRSTVGVVHGRSVRTLHITIDDGEGRGDSKEQSEGISNQEGESGRKVMSFPIGLSWCDYTGFFIPATSQLGVVMKGSLILWTLSATKPWMCKLALMWRIQDKHPALEVDDVCIREIISAESCVHGKHIKLRLAAPLWYRMTFDITEEVNKVCGYEGEGTLTIPMSSEDTIFTREERSINNDDNRQRDFRVIQERRVDQGIADLIDVYLGANNQCRKAIIQYLELLIRPSDENRISSLISLCKAWKPHLRKQFELLLWTLLPPNRITWVPIDRITKETNPLAVILETAQKQSSALGGARIIMDYCVEHANSSCNLAFLAPFFGCLRDIMKFYPDEAFRYLSRIAFIPVMHRSYLLDNCIVVHPPSLRWKFWKSKKVPLYKLKDQVFQLSVSSKESDPENEKFTHPVFMASFDALWHRQDPDGAYKESANNGSIEEMTWLKALLHMILLKTQLKSHTYVKTYDFSIEFYDNPAIAALVAYKCSGYNVLDLLAFSLPLAASAHQLVVIQQEDVQGNTLALSFSVLAVFLHMLFELRTYKSVCKFVTIIQQAVVEIRVFFVIFAGGILAFAIATLHLLRACPFEGCDPPMTKFPRDFFGALLSVYFFMSGSWDPVSEDFQSANWGFHVMMAFFFFTSVVLMLNVLIALINVAFNKGDDGWRLVWIESRLQYIEAVENMSYHIPGFRETYNYFPDVIYFSVTPKQKQETLWKFSARNCAIMNPEIAEKRQKNGNDEDDALEASDEDEGSQDLRGDDEVGSVVMEEEKEATAAGKQKNHKITTSHDKDGNVEDCAKLEVVAEAVLDYGGLGSSSGKVDSHKGKGKSVPAMGGISPIPQGNRDHELVHTLIGQVEDLQERLERHFAEVKGLLLQHSAR